MINLVARVKMTRDPLGFALVAWRAALIVATIITSTFSYLAAMAAESAKCVHLHLIAGYRSGTSDFWALPLMSLVAVVFIYNWSQQGKDIAVLQELRRTRVPLWANANHVRREGTLWNSHHVSYYPLGRDSVGDSSLQRYRALLWIGNGSILNIGLGQIELRASGPPSNVPCLRTTGLPILPEKIPR